MTDTWWEEAKKRLDECIKEQKARDERILQGWGRLSMYIPPPTCTTRSKLMLDFVGHGKQFSKINVL